MLSSGMWFVVIIVLLALLMLWWVRLGLRANEIDWGHVGLNILDGWLRIFLRRYHRYHFESIMLPKKGAVLLVSNHISGLDPLLMIGASRRPLRFMIAREQYNRFGLRWLFRAGGCIPVERRGKPEKAFREALKALHAGEVVALFPEGGIHLSAHPPSRLKRGVAVLAGLSGAPVYPVQVGGIPGEGHTLPAVIIRARARLKVFPPMDCAAMEQEACLQQLGKLLRSKA